MHHITLTDNTPFTFSDCKLYNKIHAYHDLQTVAGISLSELCKENSSLLVFPDCLGNHNDKIEELKICELSGRPACNDENQITNVDDVKIKTGNLMGFVGFSGKQNHGTKLEIRSRFTNNSGQDFFLHYMLEKVFKINLFDMNYSFSQSEVFDFMYFLFPYFLKKAINQGVFRSYQVYERNDSAVRGTIDVSRHIRQNPLFNGKVAYRSREYSYDNHITQLIRHTIEFIRKKEIGRSILTYDDETRQAVKQIEMATSSSFSIQKLRKVLHQNSKIINHPYYTHYKNLQKLCLMILTHQTMQFAKSDSPVYGILFDGAWLWEEYLNTILRDLNFEHPTNKDRKGGIRLFDNTVGSEGENSFSKCYRRIYPDFYKENSSDDKKDGIILDAKYKHLENGLVRDDLYQIISYMHTMEIDKGGFIYPDSSTVLTNRIGEDETRLLSEVEVKNYHLAGLGGMVFTVAFPITQNAENYQFFKTQMHKAEGELTSKLV